MTWNLPYLRSLRKIICTPFKNLHYCLYDLDLKIISNYAEHLWSGTWLSLVTSNFFFTILISPYPTSQRARLEECFRRNQLQDDLNPRLQTSSPQASLHRSPWLPFTSRVKWQIVWPARWTLRDKIAHC